LSIVRRPFVNAEEPIDHVVGRRTRVVDPLSPASDRGADAIAWREAFGGIRVSRGVYRFRTHAEAEEWLWKAMSRPTRT
jgi:hypothetical protein